MNKSILINCIGIKDSGGLSVLSKLLSEIADSSYKFLICCSVGDSIHSLIMNYKNSSNFEFISIKSSNYIYRIYYENIIFNKLIKQYGINLVYNFSGTSQLFLHVPQITKIHNLMFHSKKIDQVYFKNKDYFKWLKEIFFKRIILHKMLKNVKFIEVQSEHVKKYISEFINISNKVFFIKSDIVVKDDEFKQVKLYNFSKKLRFLYIVGPHFQLNHKNFKDFIKAMIILKKRKIDFEIIVTINRERLNNYFFWDARLNEITCFLGYVSKEELTNQFKFNTILISTSVIETIGLHVIEAIKNGVIAITPNEKYSLDVYGPDILTYNLFDEQSLVKRINYLCFKDYDYVKELIVKTQEYIIENENKKHSSITEIFDSIC